MLTIHNNDDHVMDRLINLKDGEGQKIFPDGSIFESKVRAIMMALFSDLDYKHLIDIKIWLQNSIQQVDKQLEFYKKESK